jgi:tRNA pseudouridine38-40 synthase
MRNLRFTLAYDGTNYSGWQRQANAIAIQEVVERVLTKICKEPITVAGSGRTDAGVHARGQVVSFRTTNRMPAERLSLALNSLLPYDIVARDSREVPQEFHARYSAQGKLYRYLIYNAKLPSPFQRNYTWHIPYALDIAAMNKAASLYVGTHDFSAFQASGGAPVDPVREIGSSYWQKNGDVWEYNVKGNGFLYHMVRNMVGTMIEVGTHKRPIESITELLQSGRRSDAGITAPAQGLYLEEVYY